MRTQAESGSNAYRARPFAIMENELAAVLAVKKNDAATAEKLLKDATTMELALDPPSGPPEPIKPSFEIYGNFLVKQGRMKEAQAQFEHSLSRMPNRRAALEGLRHVTPVRPSQAQ